MRHSEQIKLLKKIGDKAGAFVFLYNECVKHYKNRDFILNITTIIGTFVLGSSGIPATFSRDVQTAFYISIVINLFTMFMGSISLYAIVMNYGEKIGSAQWASSKYVDLYNEIQRLILEDSTNINDNQKNKILETSNEINNNFPVIPGNIYKIYKELFGENAISEEDLYHKEIIESIGGSSITNWRQTLEKYL